MKHLKREVREIVDATSILSTGEIVGFNSSINGELLFAVARNPLNYREERGIGSFAVTQTNEGHLYDIYLLVDDTLILLTTIRENYNIHDLQLLNNHELLLVCARAFYRSKDDYEKNGRIYSIEGIFQTEILLGDGIQNVQTDSNGIIWTSFFDEGVFGNFGWNEPVGKSGLIAWNTEGKKAYEFQPTYPLSKICDCYALNVISNKESWCYYYTDFPLVKIKNYKIDSYWNTPIRGSSAFAIYRNFALFSNGYNENDNLLHLLKLDNDYIAKEIAQIQIENFEKVEQFLGRRDSLYFLSNKKVFQISVQEVL